MKSGTSPTFSTMQASRPASSRRSASERANSVSCFIDIVLAGAPGSAGMWIMPMIGFCGKRLLKSNGVARSGFVIGFHWDLTGWRIIVLSLDGAARLGSPR